MITKEKLIILFFALLQLGCTTKQIEEYNLKQIIEDKVKTVNESGLEVKLNFCTNNNFNWDKIIILTPYTTAELLKERKLVNSKFIEKKLPEFGLDEDKCILLFVEANVIVRYSYVSRMLLDFSRINDKHSEEINRNIACKQLYIKKVKETIKIYYQKT